MSIDVRNVGAKGDGVSSDTRSIQQAIDQASQPGGPGHVVVPPGTYMSGTLFLRSNLKLELLPGATIKAIDNTDEYPDLPLRKQYPPHLNRGAKALHHFIFAEDCHHVTVRGGGTIDGNVEAFTPGWATKQPHTWTGASRRPFVPTIDIFKCTDVRLEGITIQNSPGWTCHLCMSDRVWIRGLRLYNYVYAGNSDGFDVDGCRDVFFSDCYIETGDDCIVLKSFPDTRSCERISIANCVLKTQCAAVKIGTESWHDFRQIVFSDSVVYNSSRVFQITSFDGAVVEDIQVSNIVADTNSANPMNRPIHFDLAERHYGFLPGQSEETKPVAGAIRRVSVSNLTVVTDGRLLLTACPGRMLEDISLRDITIVYPWIEDPADVAGKFDPLQSSASCPQAQAGRGAVVVENAERLTVDGLRVRWPEKAPGEDFLPKYGKGELMRDPRTEFEPMPPMHTVWLKNADAEVTRVRAEGFRGAEAVCRVSGISGTG